MHGTGVREEDVRVLCRREDVIKQGERVRERKRERERERER